jgi:hypothetical protein
VIVEVPTRSLENGRQYRCHAEEQRTHLTDGWR